MMSNFENYLIAVGIRSHDYTYDDEKLFQNKDYFTRCFKEGLSPYKALLFLNDYLNEDFKI